MDASERAIAGAGSAPISAEQVRTLILAAQSAWRAQSAAGLADTEFEAWRHGALFDACRMRSFRAVTQREYGAVLAHFTAMSGRPASAPSVRRASAIAGREACGEGDRRRAEAALRSECVTLDEVFGKGRAFWYAESLFEKIHNTRVEVATAAQIWQVLFTLRNRAATKRRKLQDEAAGKGTVTA